MRERKRNYELMLIISPLYADEENVTTVLNRISETIESNGGSVGSIHNTAPWGRRKLAYPIRAYAGGEASRRAFNEGFYVLLNISLVSSQIATLERVIKLTDPILRHLITVIEKKPQPPRAPATEEAASSVDDEADLDDEVEELIEEDV